MRGADSSEWRKADVKDGGRLVNRFRKNYSTVYPYPCVMQVSTVARVRIVLCLPERHAD